jgi:hypothetical protein
VNRLLCTLAACLLTVSTLSAQTTAQLPKLTPQEQKFLAPYLNFKDLTLTSSLEVRDEFTGFGTFFGTIWRVESNGAWTITRILQNKPILIGQGQLDKKNIVELARKLAAYDALSLPSGGLPPIVNPHVVTVTFGPNRAVLTIGVDQLLAPTQLENLVVTTTPLGAYMTGKDVPVTKVIPPLPPVARFSGLETVVRDLIQPNLGVELNLPLRLQQLGHP